MTDVISGRFIICLDFELSWGVKDVKALNNYRRNVLGARDVIPRLLDMFDKYGIHATFATVGFLFFRDRQQLKASIPDRIPEYANTKLSPYSGYMDAIGDSEDADPCHYAYSLVKQILSHPDHEIGSHTFSHYYCLEQGQDINDFREDLLAFKRVASKFGIQPRSFVFPRHQCRDDYLEACRQEGIIVHRGNEDCWLYSVNGGKENSLFKKALRFLDAYINISGSNCYSDAYIARTSPYNIPSSRFLRPYSPGLKFLEPLKLHRIKSAMSYAAKNKLTYHLWWHPHNFGANPEENLAFLEKILLHYKLLSKKYNFKSFNMQEAALQIRGCSIKNRKIVLLAGKCLSSNAVFNALESKFGVHTVILEEKEGPGLLLGRRIKKLGLIRVAGQALFQLFAMRFLKLVSQNRIDEILKGSGISVKHIDKDKSVNVTSVNSKEAIGLLKSIDPDMVVVSGTRIISEEVLNCVSCKFFNIHAGFIPKYRGVHGAYWALVNRDRKNCGVTVYVVDGGIDTGNILYQEPIEVTDKDNFATYPVLQLVKGIELLNKAINDLFDGKLTVRKGPDESKLWYHPTICEYFSNLIYSKIK